MRGGDGELHSFQASLTCRYALHAPGRIGPSTLLAVALHGYGSGAAAMLTIARRLIGDEHIVAALQGPDEFYADPADFSSAAAYGWGTRHDMESAVARHHEVVGRALALLADRFGIPSGRTLLAGFSQPVSLNYRFAVAHPGAVRAVVGICGGIPRAWMEETPPPIHASILHLARSEDQYFSPETSRAIADRLRLTSPDVEFHLLPGPHRVPSGAAAQVRPWLDRVFQARLEPLPLP